MILISPPTINMGAAQLWVLIILCTPLIIFMGGHPTMINIQQPSHPPHQHVHHGGQPWTPGPQLHFSLPAQSSAVSVTSTPTLTLPPVRHQVQLMGLPSLCGIDGHQLFFCSAPSSSNMGGATSGPSSSNMGGAIYNSWGSTTQYPTCI